MRLVPLASPSLPLDLLAEPWLWGAYTGALVQALALHVLAHCQLAVLHRLQAVLFVLQPHCCPQGCPAERVLPLLSCHSAAVSQCEHALRPAALQIPARQADSSWLLPSLQIRMK